jgi:hypothetical protein
LTFIISLNFLSFFSPFVVLGFELRVPSLLSRYSTTWATLPDLFTLVVLEIGCHFFAQANLDHDSPTANFLPLLRAEAHLHVQLFFLLSWGSHKLHCLAILEPQSSWSQPPMLLGLQVWAPAPGFSYFLKGLRIHSSAHVYWVHTMCWALLLAFRAQLSTWTLILWGIICMCVCSCVHTCAYVFMCGFGCGAEEK